MQASIVSCAERPTAVRGKGGFRLKKEEKATRMTVYSGERTLKVNQPLTFEFALQLTDGETLRIEPRKGWLIEVN